MRKATKGRRKQGLGWAVGLAVLMALGRMPAVRAQAPDTSAVLTVPVPEAGVLYVRYGAPGGVRIRSRHTNRVRRPVASPRTAALVQELLADPAATAGLSARERAYLERDLLRRLDAFDALVDRLGGDARLRLTPQGPVLVVRSGDGERPDTLFLDRLVPPRDGGPVALRPPADARTVTSDLAARVERSLLEAGLLHALTVNFEFDASTPLPAAAPTLAAGAEVLQRYPDLRLAVVGHTDAVGGAAYNQRLSERRAAGVAEALRRQFGIDPARIDARGAGEGDHIASNHTPTGRALNRRVEFRVIE